MRLAIPPRTLEHMKTLRAQAALFERYRGFDRCMRKLTISASEPVPMSTIAELYAHWGDPLPQGAESYLRSCLAEAARVEGPVVQCGASVLSLVLGGICSASEQPAKQLWCLEHDGHWANVIRSWLTQYRTGSAHVITSRAQLFDSYVWYAVDANRLANDISLVICDGARATPHGIIGALQRLGDRLAPQFTVLTRKISKAEDLKQLNAWALRHQAACVVVDRQEGFVKIARRPAITSV
ncbi:MAG: hypothetical protein ACNA7W_12975 [Pseudomonadales bacterium]